MSFLWFLLLRVLTACAKQPNIIFILTDDWGINDAGWTNDNTPIQTPFLDNLAKTESVILSNYYAQKVCTATRTAFLTGRYPQRVGLQNGVFHQNQPFSLTRQVSMLSNELQSNGYKTHIIGKWHLGYQSWEYTPTYRGFDTFYGYWNGGETYYSHKSSIHWESLLTGEDVGPPMIANDLYINEQPAINTPYDGVYGVWWQRDEALNLLKYYAQNPQPFFFYFALQASHTPREAPDEYVAMYDKAHDGENVDVDEYNDRINHMAQTTTVDDAMKDIVNFMKDSHLWDESLVIFGSDNGGKKLWGDNAPYRGYKNTSWEGGVKVAGFVTGGVLNKDRRGTINSYPMHMVDWYPTLLSAAGLNVKYERSTKLFGQSAWVKDERWTNTKEMELDGIDMWKYIQQGITYDDYFENEREILLDVNSVYCAHSSCGALRIGRYKYIRGNHIATLMPDYDGSDWDRSFVADKEVAEAFCTAHKDEFARHHKVAFEINSVGCQGTDRGCLFDLELDPCEYFDLSSIYPDKVVKFQSRLDQFEEEAAAPLIGEDNVNDICTRQMINPKAVCQNPSYWCPFQPYDSVMWEHELYGNYDSLKMRHGDENPMLNIWLFMALWIGTCCGLFFVFKHEKRRKGGYFSHHLNTQELQPLVTH